MNVHAAVQVSGCGECLALSLLQEGSRDTTCVRCEQVEDLLSLVVELMGEVERLRSIWDCGKGIDWWSHTLPSLQEWCGGDAPQAVGDHLRPGLVPPVQEGCEALGAGPEDCH